MSARSAADLWLPRLSMMTMSPGFEEWNELLFDIGAEAFAVDWAVEDARRRELVAAQGAEEQSIVRQLAIVAAIRA